jgi:cyanophycinase-like exopeptidase
LAAVDRQHGTIGFVPDLPRVLTIMGSGETSPTMTSAHADLLARLGAPPVPAVMLDTPFGFQENASEIAAKALTYFRENVQREIAVASWRGDPWAAPGDYETMLARVREARYVFSGPGSPSYALRHWSGSALPGVLAEKLREGGCIVFASAAAATLGVLALPVYEIYKVGADPYWLDGLNLLVNFGVNAVVVPHYNNAEGGTHDTSHCYMGERRLRILEDMMPDDLFVLGVDEHTACVIDLDAELVTVRGNGAVTLRHRGGERRIEAGASVPLDVLRAGASAGGGAAVAGADGTVAATTPAAAVPADNPFVAGVDDCRRAFDEAVAGGDVDAAQAALLRLDDYLWEWSRETFATDDMDRARALLRSMLVRLADLARLGARDPRTLVGPLVESVLAMRRTARAEGRYADADALRDALLALGVEIRDSATGTEWDLPRDFGAPRAPEAAEAR